MRQAEEQAGKRDETVVTLVADDATESGHGLFYPMDEFYHAIDDQLPHALQVEGEDVPEPYRSLLVHRRDMTPTLTDAHKRSLELRILQLVVTESVLRRLIVLQVEGTGRPVVFAAIKIYLDCFPPEARRLILEGKQAFGAILQQESIVHTSRPLEFFRVESDTVICDALQLTAMVATPALFGRNSVMLGEEGRPLAHVLEILPPFLIDPVR